MTGSAASLSAGPAPRLPVPPVDSPTWYGATSSPLHSGGFRRASLTSGTGEERNPACRWEGCAAAERPACAGGGGRVLERTTRVREGGSARGEPWWAATGGASGFSARGTGPTCFLPASDHDARREARRGVGLELDPVTKKDTKTQIIKKNK